MVLVETDELINDAFYTLEAATIAALVENSAEAYIKGQVRANKILGLGLNFDLIASRAVLATKNYRDMLEKQGGSLVTKIDETGKAYRSFTPWLKEGILEDRKKVADIISSAVESGKPLREVEGELNAVFAMRDHNAKLTSYQETRAMYNQGTFDRFKEEELTRGIWHHTDPQEHPREEHIDLDGKEFDLNDPVMLAELDKPYCHCWIEPIIPAIEGK